jgi:chromosome segregation ATPase
MKQEQVDFAKFNQWCADTSRVVANDIETGNLRIETNKAEIQEAQTNIKTFSDKKFKLETDVSNRQQDIKQMTNVFQQEDADFKATQADYVDSIDAAGQAIEVTQNYLSKFFLLCLMVILSYKFY